MRDFITVLGFMALLLASGTVLAAVMVGVGMYMGWW
jgi:hypothetical protein